MKDLVGPYRIGSSLGHGGMGVVYLGVHDHLGREVAIKALAPELTRHPEFRERFFAEARVQARLQHTNIVTIYDLIEDEGSFFIVMEHVPGPTLEFLLAQRDGKAWDCDRSLSLFRQVLAGLDYAHSKGVIHRDVKPSNVLVTDGDLVKLTDFGIALLIGDKRLTASRSTIGTPTYMSPEQILRPRSVDHRADVYSAAIVLYEMLAGRPPFDAETEYEIKKLQIEASAPDVREMKKGIPAEIAEALTVALRKNPEERFQSAGAFLRALSGSRTEVIRIEGTQAMTEASLPEPVRAPEPATRPAWRHPAALGGAAAVLVLLVSLVLLSWSSESSEPAEEPPLEVRTAASPQTVAQTSPVSSPVLPSGSSPLAVPLAQSDPQPSARALAEPPMKPEMEPKPSAPRTEPDASQTTDRVVALGRRQLQIVRQEIENGDFDAARKDLELLRAQVADLPAEHRDLREAVRRLDKDLSAAVLGREKRQEEVARGWSQQLQQARTYAEQGQPQRGRELAQDILAGEGVPEDVARGARALIENIAREAEAEVLQPSPKDRESAIRQSDYKPSDGLLMRVDQISGPVAGNGKVTFRIRYTVLGPDPNEVIAVKLTARLQRAGSPNDWSFEKTIAIRQGGGTLETPVVLQMPRWLDKGNYAFAVVLEDQSSHLERTSLYQFVVR